ncbi:MAG: ABC transporter permease [Deltaproteobacteria bacterium]|nr:ABC transporter permease [Deltaproteobacteria bacterium]
MGTEERFFERPSRVSSLRRFTRVFLRRPVVIFGLVFIGIVVLAAVFAPWVAPYDPNEQDLDNFLSHPSSEHLLGTDYLGRDSLSRIIYGARSSLIVGIGGVCIGAIFGMSLGLTAGYFGGMTYTVIMRIIDAMMCFPMLVLALAMSALLGGGLKNVTMVFGILMSAVYARMMCGQVLTVKENDYIIAAYGIGANNLRIMLRHILPNCMPPLIVQMSLMMGGIILAEAGLSFLGVGIAPPTAAWGSMVSTGYPYLTTHPILSFAPGLAIMLTVFSFNMVGDGLRDALDPRLRGTI